MNRNVCFRQNSYLWFALATSRNKKALRSSLVRLFLKGLSQQSDANVAKNQYRQDGYVKKYSSWVHSDWNYHPYVCRSYSDMWRNFIQKAIRPSGCFGRAVVALCKF